MAAVKATPVGAADNSVRFRFLFPFVAVRHWVEDGSGMVVCQLDSPAEARELVRLLNRGAAEPVEAARAAHACRICGEPESAPFVCNYGKEYAHEACLTSDLRSKLRSMYD